MGPVTRHVSRGFGFGHPDLRVIHRYSLFSIQSILQIIDQFWPFYRNDFFTASLSLCGHDGIKKIRVRKSARRPMRHSSSAFRRI